MMASGVPHPHFLLNTNQSLDLRLVIFVLARLFQRRHSKLKQEKRNKDKKIGKPVSCKYTMPIMFRLKQQSFGNM